MTKSYHYTFITTASLIFLIPLFFIPGGALQLGAAKSLVLSLGAVLLVLFYVYESWRQGGFSFPKHKFLWAALFLPVVYFLSAALSTPSSLSLLGYNLEVGTFGYMLIGSIALLVAAAVTIETERHIQALAALFASLSLIAIFAALKIFLGGEFLVLGNFSGNMANPIGSWTDMAVAFGLLASFAALSLGMIPMKSSIKAMVMLVFVLATALLVMIGFSTAFVLTFIGALFLWIYFSIIEKNFLFSGEQGRHLKKGIFSRATILPIVLALISLIMIINPKISDKAGTLAQAISGKFGIENADVRPTLSATLGVSKAVLSDSGLLGSGPNTFSQDWLIFKPLTVNATPFWGVAFPFGLGFIPTQIASTGILGTALWLLFLALLVALSAKILIRVPESRSMRFALVSTLFISLFLWLSAILFAPSASLFFIAFVFTGMLLALASDCGIISIYRINLKEHSHARPVALILMFIVLGGSIYFGFLEGKKALAAYHYEKAVELTNTEGAMLQEVEDELIKAAKLDSSDAYFTAISRLNFSKAQAVANSSTGSAEDNRAIFEDGIRRAIEGARAAVNANPAAYTNWVALGTIYSALAGEPLKVEGAYENAQYAYGEAQKRNPNNPELPLFLARLEIAKGNTDAARSAIRNSIALKEDYADAYLLLAQFEVSQNNIRGAIESAEALAVLVPQNPGVHFELGVLKFSNQNFEGAVDSLVKAIKLVPDYANAKYYLALSYSQLGRLEEAKNQLEDLLITNSENVELRAAIDALNKRAGKK